MVTRSIISPTIRRNTQNLYPKELGAPRMSLAVSRSEGILMPPDITATNWEIGASASKERKPDFLWRLSSPANGGENSSPDELTSHQSWIFRLLIRSSATPAIFCLSTSYGKTANGRW